MVSFITPVLLAITILLLSCNLIVAPAVSHSESISNNFFTRNLHPFVVLKRSTENVVYSPFSVFTRLALIYLGAEGRTAQQIHRFLKLGKENKTVFASQYGDFLNTTFKNHKPEDNGPQLFLANRFYVSSDIKIVDEFNKTAQENFDCKMENIEFNQTVAAIQQINGWVEQRTDNKIKNLLTLKEVNAHTGAIYVNAFYLKGKWLHPFQKNSTRKEFFYESSDKVIKVDTMSVEAEFGYAELPRLNATALEMPYKNSNISMLIILPDHIDGLYKLEKKLRKIDLNDITSNMMQAGVRVFLPKFRLEFETDLKNPLSRMGFSSIFSKNAKLNGIFDSDLPQSISAVKHKALFGCYEAGTEDDAVTNTAIRNRSDESGILFRANHPFAFFVRSKSTIFLAGHVARFE